MRRFRVAILGASGLVSQRMQQRLSNHPWFQLVAVAGQRKGAKLAEIPWYLEQEQTKFIAESDIEILDVHHASLAQKLRDFNVQIVFSALPSKPAFDIEKKLVDAGIHVFSNASAYRMDPDVPLVVADVNPDALGLPRSTQALHACATNCTLIPVLHPLSVLSLQHAISKVVVRSEQALSGAGWKLLLDDEQKANAIGKEIQGEAEKIIEEAERILGISDVEWDVQCTRVDERDGHLVHVQVHLEGNPSYNSIRTELMATVHDRIWPLPSQPQHPLTLIDSEPTRERDLWNGKTLEEVSPSTDLKAGMTTTVQLISVEQGIVSFQALSHNTIRGAAGGVLLLAELAYFKDLFSSVDLNPSSSS